MNVMDLIRQLLEIADRVGDEDDARVLRDAAELIFLLDERVAIMTESETG